MCSTHIGAGEERNMRAEGRRVRDGTCIFVVCMCACVCVCVCVCL